MEIAEKSKYIFKGPCHNMFTIKWVSDYISDFSSNTAFIVGQVCSNSESVQIH